MLFCEISLRFCQILDHEILSHVTLAEHILLMTRLSLEPTLVLIGVAAADTRVKRAWPSCANGTINITSNGATSGIVALQLQPWIP